MILQFGLTSLLSLILLILILILSKKSILSSSSSSPFECGFLPSQNGRMMFSLQFFLIALVFLIFDIEIIILFPSILSNNENYVFIVGMGTSFLLVLILGLALEWSQSSLEWSK